MNERLNQAVAAVLRKGKMNLPPSATNYANPAITGGGRIAKIRDRHHTIARMVAAKIPDERICSIMGMTQTSLEMLRDQTPAFQELVWHYEQREPRAEREEEYLEQKHRIAKMAQFELHDRLVEDPDSFSPSELLRIQDSYDDRTGFAKQSVHVNVGIELAQRLDSSRRRRSPAGAGDGGGASSPAVSPGGSAPPLLELSAESARSAPPEPEARPLTPLLPAPTVSPEEVHRQLSAGRSKPMPHAGKPIRRRL